MIPIFSRLSTTTTWAEHSNRIVQRSQGEIGKSMQMRSDIENLINACASDIWDSWSHSNNALARRAAEMLEAKSKLQMHLHKVTIFLNYLYNLILLIVSYYYVTCTCLS